ncbi:MAG TPA: hypothetical protein PKA10_08455 [Selenomonadales bacterium]|nr:hypothetical protein [Selenomonadales bacterium]
MAISGQEYEDLKKRWDSLLTRLGCGQAAPGIYATILGGYEHPGRHYHGGRHLIQVLNELAGVRDQLQDAAAVELALWLHDLVYEPGSAANEAISAAAARSYALQLRGSSDFAASIAALILATTHSDAPTDRDAAFLLDIDLAVLGYPPEAFAAYEDGIRQEFSFLPQPAYRRQRRTVLEAFLARSSIYYTAYFHERYERAARENISGLLAGWP